MPETSTLTLYEHKESVCCHKVAITLAEKQIPHQIVNISLEMQEQRSPWYLAINPMGMVPAIVHNGRTIIQSSIITEYLDDAFPEPVLMPRDAYSRARRRYWARRIDDEMHLPHIAAISFIVAFAALLRQRMDTEAKLNTYFNNIREVRHRETIRSWYESDLKSEVLHQSLRAYDGFLAEMEASLEETAWLAGERFSLADIDVIPYLWRLSNLQLDMLWAHRPRVTDWFARVIARPAFKTAIVHSMLPQWIKAMQTEGNKAKATLEPIIAGFRRSAA